MSQYWLCRGRKINLDRCLVMGILNVTPDSFSENGVNFKVEDAVANGLQMLADGADVLDVGGESTRPGATPVSVDEEIRRVVPVIEALRKAAPEALISVDTWKSEVGAAAMAAGADIINDVTGFARDPKLANVAVSFQAGVVLMHMRGTPQTMQNPENLVYQDLIPEINDFMVKQAAALEAMGLARAAIMLDPGLGFSKNFAQNGVIVRDFDQFLTPGYPVLLAPSRKSFIGQILDEPVAAKRDWGTAAVITAAVLKGAAMVRIHAVKEMAQVVKVAQALR